MINILNKCKVNHTGFTLAEVLITLGIIGVVAAMTIPTLINNYKEKVIVYKLPEIYSILDQAYKMSVEEQKRLWLYTCRSIDNSWNNWSCCSNDNPDIDRKI